MTYLLYLPANGQVLDFSCPVTATTRLSLVGADLSIVGPLPTKELFSHPNSSPISFDATLLSQLSALADCSLYVH